MIHLTRRDLLGILGAVVLALPFSLYSSGIDNQILHRTFTYKKVGDLEIKADVLRTNDDKVRPVVVWIHGGALINGHRASINKRVKTMMLKAGYAIVSIDYRLAPETKLTDIIQDLEDAFAWIRTEGSNLLKVDTGRARLLF